MTGEELAVFRRRKRADTGPTSPQQSVQQQGPLPSLVDCQESVCFKRHRIRESRTKSLQPALARQVSHASTSSAPVPQKKKVLMQMHLDFGQKNFHSTQCSACGFVYTPGKRDEERLHVAHHEKELGGKVIRFGKLVPPGSTLVATDGSDGRIYVVRGSRSNSKTLEVVCRMLEKELGMCDGWASAGVGNKGVAIYMYVNGAKELVGCVVVEVDAVRVDLGVIILGDGEARVERKDLAAGKKRKQCAVRVMWASGMHRREKVASKLLDCVRGQLVPGQVIGRRDVAYSQPTRDGALFIAGYSGGSVARREKGGIEFWVYE